MLIISQEITKFGVLNAEPVVFTLCKPQLFQSTSEGGALKLFLKTVGILWLYPYTEAS